MNLYILNNAIYCDTEDGNLWTITKEELVFIGEYTTSAGPFFDDWFIVFSKQIDEWWQISSYQINDDIFWKELSTLLDHDIFPGLTHSTKWASNVMYPPQLKGVELFEIIKTEIPSTTLLGKLFKLKTVNERAELTEPVQGLFNMMDDSIV